MMEEHSSGMEEGVNPNIGEKKKKCGQRAEQVDRSDTSSHLVKDSAYGSLGHSASSSMGPINPPPGIYNHLYPLRERSHTPSTTSGAGGSSLINSQSSSTMVTFSSLGSGAPKQIEPPGHKVRVSASSRKKIRSNIQKFKEAEEEPPCFLSSKDSKAVTVSTLSKTLQTIEQFSRLQAAKAEGGADKEDDIKTLVTNLTEVCQGSKATYPQRESLNETMVREQEQGSDKVLGLESGVGQESDGFCVAVSMNNGMVVHTTPSLSTVLCYPKDMWIGRSLIDFVHPKDRDYFISQVTDNVNINIKSKSKNFFCRIRMYSGLKSGFAVKERKKKFRFFKMCVCFSEENSPDPHGIRGELGECGIYLFITAIPLASPYNSPHEEGPIKSNINKLGVFATKHSAACSWTFLDENSVTLLGHFPHELEGTEIFDIIHPQDLNIVKESFENLVFSKNCKSHNYRIRTRSGDFVTVVTTWSCFVNPWNQQLEFIHGKHQVLRGPKNPNIFSDPCYDPPEKASEEKLKISSEVQDSIRGILQNHVRKNQISKMISGRSSTENKKKLSSFMGSLLQGMAKSESFELNRSSLHGAVVIGNISPHQSDSSESPPSYNQLTYNENLTRFFNSQPKTLSEKDLLSNLVYSSPSSYEDNPKEAFKQQLKSKKEQRKSKSGEACEDGSRGSGDKHSGQGSGEQPGSGTGKTVSGSGENEAKNSSSLQIGLSAGHIIQGAEESIMSQEQGSMGSGSRLGSGSRDGVDDYKPPVLTEDLLVLHNREMEQQMVTNFKKARRIGEVGFLKEGKKIDQTESKKVMVSKNIAKNEAASGTTMRQPLSTIPEILNKSASHSNRQESAGPSGQEYQRPLAFTDSHFSSYSGTSTPNININTGLARRGSEGQGISYPVPFIQGPVAEDGSQKFIQVPAIMIPITCANTASSSPVFSPNMPMVNMMMPSNHTGFIPLCMGEPVMYNMGGRDPQAQEALRGPRNAPPRTQFELPNCLAVNSCMTHQEQGATKKAVIKRQMSGEGSRHTSIKGEPGVPAKAKTLLDPTFPTFPTSININAKQQTKLEQEICSSSQSLYSFLHSSDDIEVQDYLQAESSYLDDSEDDKLPSVRQVARPVLSEPFWNEGVVISETLMKTYQMEELDFELVLKRDLEKLEKMKQSELVNAQLKELEGFMEAVEDFAFQNVFVDNEEDDEDEDVTDTTSGDDGEKDDSFNRIKKKLNKVRNLEKLNMFMEENAPFPENLSSPKKATDSVTVKDDLKESGSSADEKKEHLSSIVEAFKMTVGKAGSSSSRNRTPDSHEMFTSSRPQASRFQYGKGMETNTITQSDTQAMEEKEKDPRNKNESSGNSTDTTSSEEILRTSSSEKSSHHDNDQKRKKGSTSPESNVSAVKQEDKKLKYASDSSENKMFDTTDSEGVNKEKE